MTDLRIALFTGNYNHIADGVSLTLNRLVRYLEAQGIAVLVFAPTVPTPPVDHAGTLEPVPSFAAPGRPEYRVSRGFPRAQRKRLAAFKPTLVHIATPDLLGLGARRWALNNGIPVVSTYHTHFSSYLSYYNMGWLEKGLWAYLRWFYQACRHLYVPTPSMLEVLQQHGITEGLKIWPRGVETERFHPRNRAEAWRAELGFAPDDVVVTFISRLVWEKGLGVYAEVIERLRAAGVPHRSLMVGDGPAQSELAARLPETVFTGYLGGADLARAYASADLFLFPSASETFGNVTLEAMASGLPAVCADATGSKSLVVHEKTGFLATTEDADDFYGYVVRLLEDAALRQAMGKAARERAELYDWAAVLSRMPAYYQDALEV